MSRKRLLERLDNYRIIHTKKQKVFGNSPQGNKYPYIISTYDDTEEVFPERIPIIHVQIFKSSVDLQYEIPFRYQRL